MKYFYFILGLILICKFNLAQLSNIELKQTFDECYVLDTLKHLKIRDTISFVNDYGNECTCIFETGRLVKTISKFGNGNYREFNYLNGNYHGVIASYNKHGLVTELSYVLFDTLFLISFANSGSDKPFHITVPPNNKTYIYNDYGKLEKISIDTLINKQKCKINYYYHKNESLGLVFIEAWDELTQFVEYYPDLRVKREGKIKYDGDGIVFDPFNSKTNADYAKCEGMLRVGLWKEYWPNGILRLESRFTENPIGVDIRDGLWYYYDEQGKLMKEEEWKNNLLIK